MASLAAVFAALQCPTADVRCITFGSQLVGNAAFADAFRCATPHVHPLLHTIQQVLLEVPARLGKHALLEFRRLQQHLSQF